MHHGAARYRQASIQAVAPRETEIAAFGSVIRALSEAADETARIRALGRNHDLWSVLVKDLGLEGNGLPEALKTQLVGLGFWSMRYSTLAILQKLPVEPLLDVNRNVMEGLALQVSIGQAAQPSSIQAAI
jgi:flagellar biosynthesis activator protein FlaF